VRRGVVIGVAVLLAVAGVFGVLLFFSARDDSTIGESGAPGQAAPEATGAELESGNVVVRFSAAADAAPLRELAREFGPESLADAGQAVLVRRDESAGGVVAEAYRRRLKVAGPEDPALRRFIEPWLGRGASQ
jgi:hypothetical protein